MPADAEASARKDADPGDGDAPVTDQEDSVRPSAPTLQGASGQGASGASSVAQRPVVVRSAAAPSSSPGTPDPDRPSGPGEPNGTSFSSPTSTRGLVGALLGRYRIIEELGHGGMATVYRARDPRLERDVALKVIHRHLRENEEIAQRFRHEARAVAKLKHPSIVEIYDVPDEALDGERFLVAELVEGPSLRKYLQSTANDRESTSSEVRAPMPPEIAAAFLLQVLGALGRAHEEGIIHRDVKPENILISAFAPTSQRQSDPSRTPPVAKLTDFGIAKILDAQSMTSTGQILGSPAHMAPEQIEGGEIGPRVDIFASGVLFYELCTGVLPFDGKNPAQVIRRVLDGEFMPAERVMPTVGGRWSAIIASMLERDPAKRPASAEDLAKTVRLELEAMRVTDPDRELVDFLRDPSTISRGWGPRMKPVLLERGVAARAAGDVVGAANALNRALAYDPSDARLVRTVTAMRARERRVRALRRGAPLLLAAICVVAVSFGVVRWLRHRPSPSPPAFTAVELPTAASSGTGAAPSNSMAGSPSTGRFSATTRKDGRTVPSGAGTAPIGSPTAMTGGGAGGPAKTRRVHFNVFPPRATYSIDGGPMLEATNADQVLTVGEHTIDAAGVHTCCVNIKNKRIKLEAGDTPQTIQISLKLNDAKIIVNVPRDGGRTNIAANVTVTSGGQILRSGPAPLSVPMTDLDLTVTVIAEANGFQKKTQEFVTLSPGNPTFIDLTPE